MIVKGRGDPNLNRLYYGDNLQVLREHVAVESIDIVYLDPPFNSNRYAHLWPDDEQRSRDAIDALFRGDMDQQHSAQHV